MSELIVVRSQRRKEVAFDELEREVESQKRYE